MSHLTRVIGRFLAWFRAQAHPVDGVDSMVVGLGNPDDRYRQTRHNVGFRVVDVIAERCRAGEEFRVAKAVVRVAARRDEGRTALVKPLTYMNRSGEAVSRLMQLTRVGQDRCVVVVDDVNLPVGKIRVRRNGSDGGHNGLKSVVAVLGEGFPRVRVGVGPVPSTMPLMEFVLGPFAAAEQPAVQAAEARAAEAVLCLLEEGVETAMNRYN